MKSVQNGAKVWESFTSLERRNIIIYTIGIFLYRFGSEVFNLSIITLAMDRFSSEHTFEILGALIGVHQAVQLLGAILIVCPFELSRVNN